MIVQWTPEAIQDREQIYLNIQKWVVKDAFLELESLLYMQITSSCTMSVVTLYEYCEFYILQ